MEIVPKRSNEDVLASIVRGSNCNMLLRPVIKRMSRELGASRNEIASVLRLTADRLDGANTTEDGIKQRKTFDDERAKDCRADFHVAPRHWVCANIRFPREAAIVQAISELEEADFDVDGDYADWDADYADWTDSLADKYDPNKPQHPIDDAGRVAIDELFINASVKRVDVPGSQSDFQNAKAQVNTIVTKHGGTVVKCEIVIV